MRKEAAWAVLAMAVLAIGAGGSADVAGAAAPASKERGDAVSVTWRKLKTRVPAGWEAQQPTSSMRVAQYRVPGARGSGDAELIVFYFGQDQGGSADANIARWTSQFSSSDGKPVQPAVERFTVGGMPVTVAELTGTYARSMGMGGQGEPKPDQTLLAAVVETAAGNLFVQLHGPRATVAANKQVFLRTLRDLKP